MSTGAYGHDDKESGFLALKFSMKMMEFADADLTANKLAGFRADTHSLFCAVHRRVLRLLKTLVLIIYLFRIKIRPE